jgi:hypothetical protein
VATNFFTPGPLQEAIAQDIPQVAAVVKLNSGPEYLIKVGDKADKERGHFVTEDFFGVFDLPIVAGNPKAALKKPDQLIRADRSGEIAT